MIELTKEYQKIATGPSRNFNVATGYLELWAKYNSNDSNTNRTNYSVQLRLVVQNGYIGNYQSTPWTIDGDIKVTGDAGSGSHYSKTLGTATGTVTHDADGTKNVTMSGSFNATAWGIVLSVNGSAKLPDLHTPPAINSVNVTEQNTILKNAGISNETFVKWLSKKSFAFDVTTYDDATITSYEVANAKTLIASSEQSPFNVDFANFNLYGDEAEKTTELDFKVIDSKNGSSNLSKKYEFVPYFKPTFVNTNTKALRQGQTSGRAILNANGSFYNVDIGSLSPSCKVFFKYWAKGEDEPTTYNEIPNESLVINENTFTINQYLLGTDFDYKKSYYVSVYIEDRFYSSEPLVLPIPVGESTWTEYKDRVDFIKATVRGKEVATKEEVTEVYSTEETKTNKVWLDGRPIYKKTFTGVTGSTAGGIGVEHGIENFDMLVNYYGNTYRYNDKECRPIPNFYITNENNLYAIVLYYINDVNFSLTYGSQRTGLNFNITLEYVKTND